MHYIRNIFLNFWVAIAYFLGGMVGNLLAIEPSNSSPVWPSSGLALAVLLIYGWRVLPGLFIGIFCTQLYVSFGFSVIEALENTFVITLVKAFASTAQAIIGMLLIQRFVGRHNALLDLSKIFQFFFYGAIVSCVVAPTISLTAFYLQNIITANDFPLAWLIWWVGDVIGVLIFTPIVLAFLAKPESIWPSRRYTLAIPLIILFTAVIFMFYQTKQQEAERVRLLFNHRVEQVQDALKDEIFEHRQIAENIRDFINANKKLSKDEFHLITRSSLKHHPDLVAIEWTPRIIDKRGLLISTPNKISFSIKYIEPLKGNERALGLDISKNKVVFNTINKLIITGQSSLSTGLIHLHQDKDKEHSRVTSIIYAPLYKKNKSNNTAEARIKNLQGVVAVVFTLEDHKTVALNSLIENELKIEITSNNEVFYSNFVDKSVKPISFATLQTIKTFKAAGNNWQVWYRPSAQFLANQTTWYVWWVLIGGLLITSFIGVGLLVFTGRAAYIAKQVALKTKDLSRINSVLNREVVLRQQLEAEQFSRNAILEALAKGEDFKIILKTIVQSAEKLNKGINCSILLLDEKGKYLNIGADIGLPDFYKKAIGTGEGACGTTAYKSERVVVENIMQHPDWTNFKNIAKKANFHSCWCEPIISSKNKVLGTFSIYYKQVTQPSQEALDFMKRMADLTAITIERKYSEDELRIAATTFQSHDAVVITDTNSIILRINQAYTQITGYSADEVLGKNASILSSGLHDKAFFADIYQELAKTGQWEGEIWNHRKNGELFAERITMTALIEGGEITHYVGIFSDISDKKAKEEEIKQLAFFDPLTSLANRRLLLEHLDLAIISAKRHHHCGAVIFMDLDYFKILNDTLGHQVGDELLIQVANRIKSVIRDEDTACRLGGDEFVILISGYDSSISEMVDQAAIVAEKIRQKINFPFDLSGSKQIFSTSIGVSVFPDKNLKPEQILEQADTAMYRSKQAGRNVVSFFSVQMQQEHNRKANLERMLQKALSQQQFVVYYQGQTNIRGELLSVEALLRWIHPEQGMVSPTEFIPIAEASHLIVDIGNWVLTEACQQIKLWQQAGLYIEHVAVNISPRQFRQGNFVEQIKNAVAIAGIEAKYLMLELTEGIVIDNISDTINKMLKIKEMGISISIDDFGTGYSSLAYLKQLPLTQLKIDQSFVRDINIDSSDEVIVESIIALAHKLGLDVIAEGVETAEQLQFLQDNGCEKYQGYYFCHPMPAAEIVQNYLDTGRADFGPL
ncbi:MAG: EAL domain-containing protein [Methylococcales bacterium]